MGRRCPPRRPSARARLLSGGTKQHWSCRHVTACVRAGMWRSHSTAAVAPYASSRRRGTSSTAARLRTHITPPVTQRRPQRMITQWTIQRTLHGACKQIVHVWCDVIPASPPALLSSFSPPCLLASSLPLLLLFSSPPRLLTSSPPLLLALALALCLSLSLAMTLSMPSLAQSIAGTADESTINETTAQRKDTAAKTTTEFSVNVRAS